MIHISAKVVGWFSFLIVLLLTTLQSQFSTDAQSAEQPANTKSVAIEELVAATHRIDVETAEQKWTYEKLAEASDIIVVGEFESKASIESPEEKDYPEVLREMRGSVMLVKSTFKVSATLRKKPSIDKFGEMVSVKHFQWKPGTTVLIPVSFVDFSRPVLRQRTFAIQLDNVVIRPAEGKPLKAKGSDQYLMFLLRRADGDYEPATGQVFPELSFRRVCGLNE